MTTPITTLANIKSYAGDLTSNTDAPLSLIMGYALPALNGFCNRTLTSTTVTEYRNGNNSQQMVMTQYPITSVASVVIDGVPIPASTPASVNGPATAGYSFVPGGRMVLLTGYVFTRGSRNVQITLTGGYGDGSGAGGADLQPWPQDLVMAYTLYCVVRLKERPRLGIGSQTMAGQSVTYADGPSGTSSGSMGMPAAAALILKNYTNNVPESGL
ncbi:MAG TPA: hypothetical protein VNW52_00355 [Burkholderiaceae bacterium]|jgi:hypothetical protein|nr:hypothetical protein [Burkholderiaceae bacterium]